LPQIEKWLHGGYMSPKKKACRFSCGLRQGSDTLPGPVDMIETGDVRRSATNAVRWLDKLMTEALAGV
jgi:hypothetical protein